MKKGKILAVVLAVLLASISVSPVMNVTAAGATTKFKDVKDSYWASAQIQQAVQRGYVSGFPDGTFKPEQKVSRAEFIRMLVDALKLPHIEKGSPWYLPYVASLIDAGIHKEADFKKYDEQISRMEMVRLAVRSSMSNIAAENPMDNRMMFVATEKGILHGMGKGELAPKGASTRAQAVAIIERILSVNAGKKLSVDKYAVSNAEIAWHHTNVFTIMPEFFRSQYPDEVERGVDPIEKWDVSKMTLMTKDGSYKGTIDQIVAIDLSDPQDPNRYLLGDIKNLQWYADGPIEDGVAEGYPVKDQQNSYIIYFDGHLDYNKDKNKYNDRMPFSVIYGANPTDKEMMDFYKGKLNKTATVFIKGISDFPAIIIPKSSTVQYNDLAIQISTPAYSGVEGQSNEIVRVAGPQRPYVNP